MARIRTIKPEFWTSEQVVECSRDARLLFIGIWNFCDDAGIHPFNERQLKMKVFPGDDISSESIRRLLDELSANGLILVYQSENQSFLKVTGWKHQKIDKPTYRYPPPPSGENSPPPRRALAEASPPEGSLRVEESKGREESESLQQPEESQSRAREPSPNTEPPSKSYRFAGKVIKLNSEDFEGWAKAYHAIPDLEAELRSLDDFYASKPAKDRGNWFVRCSAALAKKHQERMANAEPEAGPDDESWRRIVRPEDSDEIKAMKARALAPDIPAAPPDPGTDPDWMKLPDDLDRRPKNKLA